MIVSMVPACVIPSHNHSKLTLCAADLAGFRNQQLFVSGPGNVNTRGQIIDINRSPKIEIPRLRKRQHSAPGYLSQLSPREAERLRDGYDSTPNPAYSSLRCSATWLLYSLLAGCSVCHFAHPRPTMPSISLITLGSVSFLSYIPCTLYIYIYIFQ